MEHRSILEKLATLDQPDHNLDTAIYATCQGFKYDQDEDGKYRFFQGGRWVKPGEQYPDSGQFVLCPIPEYTRQWSDAVSVIPYPWRISRLWESDRKGLTSFWSVEIGGVVTFRDDLETTEKSVVLSAGGFRLPTIAICFVGLQARALI